MAEKLFSTNNDQGICAGYSQTWLVLSLLAGAPHTQANSIVQNAGQISQIHRGVGVRGKQRFRGLGGASTLTLPESGLAIRTGYPKLVSKNSWGEIYGDVATEGDGYYYLTMKAPSAHAMACILLSNDAYYLEPQSGLFKMPKSELAAWAAEYYGYRRAPSANTDFKVYGVDQGA